jgi:hypothetical protein
MDVGNQPGSVQKKKRAIRGGGVSLMPASNGPIAREEFATGLLRFWLSYKLRRPRRNIF